MLQRGLPRAALSKLVDNLQLIQVDEVTEALGMKRSDPPAPQEHAGLAPGRSAKRKDLEIR